MKDGELRFAGFRYTSDYPGAQPEGIARAVDWSNLLAPSLMASSSNPRKLWSGLPGQSNVTALNC